MLARTCDTHSPAAAIRYVGVQVHANAVQITVQAVQFRPERQGMKGLLLNLEGRKLRICRKVDSNTLLSIVGSVFHARRFQYMV